MRTRSSGSPICTHRSAARTKLADALAAEAIAISRPVERCNTMNGGAPWPGAADGDSMTMASRRPGPRRQPDGRARQAREGGRRIRRGRPRGREIPAPGRRPQGGGVRHHGLGHPRQRGRPKGQLAGRLAALDAAFGGLKAGLGPVWNDTAVLLATEFGRTAAENGTRGTDHGTATAAFLVGGARQGRAGNRGLARSLGPLALSGPRSHADAGPARRHEGAVGGSARRPGARARELDLPGERPGQAAQGLLRA